MQVLKFGGTSVGSAQRIKEVAALIDNGKQKVVVLSAMTGTTNALVEIANYLYKKNLDGANEKIALLEKNYFQVVDELLATEKGKALGIELVKSHFNHLRSFTREPINLYDEKDILAQGELLSTTLMQFYLEEKQIKSHLISALNFMRIDKFGEPDDFYIKENLNREIKQLGESYLIITQGFICRNAYGKIDNLQRGGSDYSATLIGAALEVDEVQIWTDIDGVHTNDPRIVENTHAISELSFDEAAELAYFGAKILHPTCVTPAKIANIPVRIKNTLDPAAPGTLITSNCTKKRVRAIAAKDGITAIKIKSGRMLMAHGFLRKVFEIFEAYKTSIDMITTSEVGVSVSIDDAKFLDEIVDDLKKYGTVDIDSDQVIICVVGDLIADNKGIAASIFNALKEVPLRMISYGGSNHNISVLVKAEYKKTALVALSQNLFND
ncbi:MAG: aspartate kinase [Bacteroidetes bacterium HGW-Bacteroidetes-4]|nr:MAG: aspartate kinase [Bacteroidetes bacterium HGW-Bacteroidetes-4]